MPKITLHNTETGKDEDFEPVDAREILDNPDSIYTVPDETREQIGMRMDPNPNPLGADGEKYSIPNLQGGDAEMQTGLSVDKYARNAVVKAQPGDPRRPVLTTQGELRTPADPTAKGRRAGSDPADSSTMTVAELKAALDKRGVEYAANAKKPELIELHDAE